MCQLAPVTPVTESELMLMAINICLQKRLLDKMTTR